MLRLSQQLVSTAFPREGIDRLIYKTAEKERSPVQGKGCGAGGGRQRAVAAQRAGPGALQRPEASQPSRLHSFMLIIFRFRDLPMWIKTNRIRTGIEKIPAVNAHFSSKKKFTDSA